VEAKCSEKTPNERTAGRYGTTHLVKQTMIWMCPRPRQQPTLSSLRKLKNPISTRIHLQSTFCSVRSMSHEGGQFCRTGILIVQIKASSIQFCFWRRDQNFGNIGRKIAFQLKRDFIWCKSRLCIFQLRKFQIVG
jgi:hypothetical protein